MNFSWYTPVSSTNKTNGHDITEILLRVALNTITINCNKVDVISMHLNIDLRKQIKEC
jgi:hypothetical protein